MAIYPVSQGGLKAMFSIAPDAGTRFTPMADGTIRGYSDYTEEVYTITITHFWLGKTDRDAIIAFYDANKLSLNSVAADEGNFDGYFVNRPAETEKSGPYSMLVSTLRGTKV